MSSRVGALTERLRATRNPGASETEIRVLLDSVKVKLPGEYLEFLRIANGAEGYMCEGNYLSLYSIDEVIECNRAFGEWLPWFVFIGTSGSISGYGLDTRSISMPVLEADWIGLDSNPIFLCGMSFVEFLENLSQDIEPRRLGPHPLPL